MHVSYVENENELYVNRPLPLISYQLSETRFPYLHWTERHLQVMWWEQKYFKNLKTQENLPIEIISPGIWNAEAGPDFLKAHLKIGDQEVKGDIEIHLNDENWAHHKHHFDSRYDNVILHLSLWKPHKQINIINSKGQSIHQAYLENSITISQTRILQLIDIDQYPYRKFVGSGRCSQSLFKNMSNEKIFDLFESAAERRLTEKAYYLKEHIEDQRLLLPAGIAMTLGYKHNSESFFELFLRLLRHKDRSEQELLAMALGMCGFFSEDYQLKWRTSTFYYELFNTYNEISYLVPYSIPLILHKVRPLNHPIRRMVHLVKLLKDPLMLSLYPEIQLCWHQHWPAACLKNDWFQFRQKIIDRIPSYMDNYWNQHYIFEKEPRKQHLSLFGKDLKEIVIVNIVLPLLYVEVLQRNNLSEIQAFRDFYYSIPAIHNSKSSYISHRFFGDLPKGQILQKALSQQGAFQIHRDFCMQHEASCEGCSFVDKYNKSKNKKKK